MHDSDCTTSCYCCYTGAGQWGIKLGKGSAGETVSKVSDDKYGLYNRGHVNL